MLNLLMNRKSVRKYKDKEVSQNIIDKIVKGALTSPTGRNTRPWELIIVKDKTTLKKLSKARGRSGRHIEGASFGAVIAVNPEITDLWIEDASIMGTIIQLLAQDEGLSSCWIQVRGRIDSENKNVEESVKQILNIPDNYRVETMISIGYPDEDKKLHKEEELLYHKVHQNKFKIK